MDVADWEVEGSLEHAQRAALQKALVQGGYNVSHAARTLRIGRGRTYRLMEKYGFCEITAPQKVKGTTRTPIAAGRIVFNGSEYMLVR